MSKSLILQNGKTRQISENDILENTGSFIGNYYPTTTRLIISPCNSTAFVNSNIIANTVYALPIILEKRFNFSELKINVITANALSSIRLAIYNSTLNSYPDQKILESGILSGATTGVKSFIFPNTNIQKGLYFLIIVSSTNLTVRGFAISGLIPILGTDLNLTNQGLGYSYTGSITLPTAFPVSNIITNIPLPIVGIK